MEEQWLRQPSWAAAPRKSIRSLGPHIDPPYPKLDPITVCKLQDREENGGFLLPLSHVPPPLLARDSPTPLMATLLTYKFRSCMTPKRATPPLATTPALKIHCFGFNPLI